MKHTLRVTALLFLLFLSAHFIGFFVIDHYLPETSELPLGIEKPDFEESTSYMPIMIAILIATVIALILIKFKAHFLWKAWFFLSIVVTLSISFTAFIPQLIAVFLAILLALLKLNYQNVYLHNFTELFIYGGLAALFVPILSILSAIILLGIISLYDMIAVWKTKHMVSLANFQAKNKIFAGLNIPYKILPKNIKQKKKTKKVKVIVEQAVLGGGDIGFTLIFSGVILKFFGLWSAVFVSLTTSLALLALFFLAEKKKFYPAMPFLTTGCLLGYAILVLL